jgi:hypothetical protein
MGGCSRKRAHHNPGAGIATGVGYMSSGEVPQPPLEAIARDSVPYGATDHKADARPVRKVRSMDYQSGPGYAYPTPGCLPEILRAAHSQRSGQHASRSTLRQTGGYGPYGAGPK